MDEPVHGGAWLAASGRESADGMCSSNVRARPESKFTKERMCIIISHVSHSSANWHPAKAARCSLHRVNVPSSAQQPGEERVAQADLCFEPLHARTQSLLAVFLKVIRDRRSHHPTDPLHFIRSRRTQFIVCPGLRGVNRSSWRDIAAHGPPRFSFSLALRQADPPMAD